MFVAEDRLLDKQIAEEFAITIRTLARWKLHPDFQEWVEKHRQVLRDAVLTTGIADKVNRVRRLDTDWQRMQAVISQRAAAAMRQAQEIQRNAATREPDAANRPVEEFAEAPGMMTGLVVKTVKGIGKGDDFQIVEIYNVDTGLLAEMRNTEKQAAQELGQWVEKGELSGPNGSPLQVRHTREELSGMDTADLARAIAEKVGHS